MRVQQQQMAGQRIGGGGGGSGANGSDPAEDAAKAAQLLEAFRAQLRGSSKQPS